MVHDESMIYEYIWVIVVAAIVAGLTASLAYYGIALDLNPVCNATPIDVGAITTEFKPGVRQVGPGHYEVWILAGQFFWDPNKIVLQDPVRVDFKITSKDVVHGFEIVGTSVNVMVVPGYIAEFTWEPPKDAEGKYLIICHEYCGIGHQNMMAELIIERSTTTLDAAYINATEAYGSEIGYISDTVYLEFKGVIEG